MPRTQIHLFQKSTDHTPPLDDWLKNVEKQDKAAHAKCLTYLLKLAEWGYELDRPIRGKLSGKIYELRPTKGRVHYRILYFFHGRNAVVLSHGITKTKKVPPEEIARAERHKELVEQDFEAHTTTWI